MIGIDKNNEIASSNIKATITPKELLIHKYPSEMLMELEPKPIANSVTSIIAPNATKIDNVIEIANELRLVFK